MCRVPLRQQLVKGAGDVVERSCLPLSTIDSPRSCVFSGKGFHEAHLLESQLLRRTQLSVRTEKKCRGLLRLHTQWRRLRRAASRQTRRNLLLSGYMMDGSCTGVMEVDFANNVNAAFAPHGVLTSPSHPGTTLNLNESISCTRSRPQRGRYCGPPLQARIITLDLKLGQQSLREYECVCTKRSNLTAYGYDLWL
jgi:hypothetical protein